jgi:tight adherence protein C
MTLDHAIHDPNILSTLCGFAAFAVVILIWVALVDNDPLPLRLKSITQRRGELRGAERQKKMSRRTGMTRIGFIKQVAQKMKLEQGKKLDELRLKLARAGYRSRDMMFVFLFLKMATPVAFVLLTFFFIFVLQVFKVKAIVGLLIVMVSGVLGFMAPEIFIKNKSQKRGVILRKAMPDALDLMVICAEAGLSLDSSFERVSREVGSTSPELAEEIGLTAVELSFLPDRSKALQNLAARVPLPGVVALSNTLIQTEKYGTPLTQALRILSAEMRDERIMAAEAKAAKLPATLTIPMILFILPPLFVVLIGPAALKVMSVTSGH